MSREPQDSGVDLARLRAALESAPPPARRAGASKMGVVRELLPQIRKLQAQGHLIRDIAALLAQQGLDISGPVLTTYLVRLRGEAEASGGVPGASEASAAPDASARPPPQAPAARGAGKGSEPAAPPPAARPPAAVERARPAPRDEAEATPARRGTFVPKPDTPLTDL